MPKQLVPGGGSGMRGRQIGMTLLERVNGLNQEFSLKQCEMIQVYMVRCDHAIVTFMPGKRLRHKYHLPLELSHIYAQH